MTTENPTPGVPAAPTPTLVGGGVAPLARFLADRSESAFASVVGEHGGMVYGVCRRILGNSADAEDAFQATFLVLARDAARVVRRDVPVGAWLYGTAYRLAKFARRTAARRAAREHRQAKPMASTPDPTVDVAAREAGRVVDDELHRLPDRYQQPVVLCYLSGLTHDQAAEQLGVHPRTLERRLRAGLDLLRDRLVVRGVTLSVVALAAVLTAASATATPPPLAQATAQAAAGSPVPAAVTALVNAERAGRLTTTAAWAGGIAAVLVAGGVAGWIGLNGFGAKPTPVPAATADDDDPAVVSGAAAAGRGDRTVTVRGRVIGPDGMPLVGVEVALLARPVRLTDKTDKTFDPIDDPLADVVLPKGRFRALARGTTDADGKYQLTGAQQVPDPTTGAVWYHTLPWAFVDGPHRLQRQPAEFKNLQIIPLGR
jgi:RNA polymerase sigma factor (sigma-70 family)